MAGKIAQRTLKNRIKCSGIGLHSGAKVQMVLNPAAPDTGVVFRRVDLPGKPLVRARHDQVTDLRMCTTVAAGEGVSIGTVEHLLAALAGMGVDNVLVDIDGPEVPVMDGSSAPFVFLIECADVIEQVAPRKYLKVLKPVHVRDGAAAASLLPGEGFVIDFEIEFANKIIGRQTAEFQLEPGRFKADIARARTFGFVQEVEQLRAMGLARGGSLENAVVLGHDRILNDDGLRYEDEFVRHKILDALGDLYLAGAPIIGRYHGVRSGHALNNRLLKALFADETAYAWTTHAKRDLQRPLAAADLGPRLHPAVAEAAL
ncbi:MAG TPA: UDP-3-O-acyl-N-acetylglucosamine deacetylase [Ferrovibrio sp.]|uniref:UDP-3-O-acyl-N-acetylglucosamine deacetylase n=1 Tax=Ferrovibrio sp. TaxID=1917215 RepID=UPI002B4AE794|nr:UDP-3-O-acyl-N-acetylglucosamine deacetylase [Ferrovibrio sp.]HLT78450.1 UDP-3-O-acyl-N-acetylglucosamine deacetylase [Ferrovibrio sp.]